ncbi:tripartite tricarboxylate transporter substrate binding protein (plasmid) [Polaromonas sp. P1-6]|nr:tripartite tricarboxylate transporter substrate binding protein [Polaromonas sp. P1-6]
MKLSIALKTRRTALLALALPMIAGTAMAQDKFPSRPLKIVVGSEAGSAPDQLARVVANEMGPLLGQSIIIENKSGAAGTIGAAAVATATADGYTLLMGTVSNIALAPSFYPVKYDPNKSFTPIGMVASVPLVLVTTPSFGIQNFAQLQAKAKQMGSSGQFAYSSPGVGGPQHLAGVLLQRQLGLRLLHIPYKSGGAAMTAVAAGEVQLAFAGIPAAASLAQAKKVVPLFVTSTKRSRAMNDVPSATEAGLPAFDIDNWHALFAPAGLPPRPGPPWKLLWRRH